MRLSHRGEYALRALINLGIAAEVKREWVQVSELAKNERIPVKFLSLIMHAMKEQGLIESARGRFGGYRLAKSPREITLGSVVRLIDGPLAPIGCVSQSAYEKCSCPDEKHCGLRMIMLDVRNAISGILDRYTLADVVGITLRKLRSHEIPIPFTPEAEAAGKRRKPARPASRSKRSRSQPGLDETEGVLHELLGEYTI